MKILAIAPYEGLKETFKKVGAEYQYNLDVELSDFCKGVELSRRVRENRADIIISRGGTASYIEKELPVPVVEVEVSGYDILRILTFIKDYEGKKGLIAFSQIANGARTICDILNINISVYAVNSEEEVQERLEKMKKENYEVVIGDVIAVQKAELLGLNGFLLTSGEESVKKAFEQARKLFEHLQEVKSSLSPLEQYLEKSSDAVVFLSSTNVFLFKTDAFTEIEETYRLNQRDILSVVDRMKRSQSTTTSLEKDNQSWDIELRQLDRGAIALKFNKNKLDHKKYESHIKVIDSEWHLSRTMKTFLTTSNNQMKEVLERAKQMHQGTKNVWINGAIGTGKESLAHFIHYGELNEGADPLVIIRADMLTQEELLTDNKLASTTFTVLLLNVERLTYEMQQRLLDYIREHKSLRFLVTCSIDIEDAITSHEFLKELYEPLSDVRLHLPELAERIEDIEHLSLSFIHEWNLELGKQVVGLRPEALDLLKEQSWEGNINQLKAVIKDCVSTVTSAYIECDVLNDVLNKNINVSSPYSIDLSGTLEDIEDRIIFKIWNDEGQNRTKTARRLGINRTTLWRRLNKSK